MLHFCLALLDNVTLSPLHWKRDAERPITNEDSYRQGWARWEEWEPRSTGHDRCWLAGPGELFFFKMMGPV